MALTLEERQAWKDRHTATSARMLELHKRWGGQRPLEPAAGATYDQDHQALIKDFEQFKEMPDEVWHELLADDGPNKVA